MLQQKTKLLPKTKNGVSMEENINKAIELYKSGLSIDKVAFEIGVKRSRLNAMLKAAGVELRKSGARKGHHWGVKQRSK